MAGDWRGEPAVWSPPGMWGGEEKTGELCCWPSTVGWRGGDEEGGGRGDGEGG